MKYLDKITTQFCLYGAAAVLAYLAKLTVYGISLNFLWLIFLPITTAAIVYTYDTIIEIIDFKDDNMVNRELVLAILSAGFAIALAIFYK